MRKARRNSRHRPLLLCLSILALIAACIAVPAAAEQRPGGTELVSTSSAGVQADGGSLFPKVSDDGRFVAFASTASNLVDADTNGAYDIFVRDRQERVTTRVSMASDGGEGNERSCCGISISGDGRYVAFDSLSSNLVPADANQTWDVFVHDRQTGSTTRVSVASDGSEGNLFSFDPSISSDGRFVAFHSWASNLVSGDTNDVQDVFVHDRQTGTTTRASVASDGTQADGFSSDAVISADGRYVAYNSSAPNLVAGDTNGELDVFVLDRETGGTTRASVATDGSQGSSASFASTISGDGRYVAFDSNSDTLAAGDTNGVVDVFVHDRETGVTERVSLAADGREGNDQSFLGAVTADGRYVAFFSRASNLVGRDTNESGDVFLRDRQGSTTTVVSVFVRPVLGNAESSGPSISADGRYVGFWSGATNLVAERDTNDTSDAFLHDRFGHPGSP